MRILTVVCLFVLVALTAQCQTCHTDSFTVDNFNDRVEIHYVQKALDPCELRFRRCTECFHGNAIVLPNVPNNQKVTLTIIGATTAGNRIALLNTNCTTVHIDECWKPSNGTPYSFVGNYFSGYWVIRVCLLPGQSVKMSSEPYQGPAINPPPIYTVSCQ